MPNRGPNFQDPISLPYGRVALPVRLPAGSEVCSLLPSPRRMSAPEALTRALASPVAAPQLAEQARGRDRVVVIVSDDTRDEPRGDFLTAIVPQLNARHLTLAIANGTHGPCTVSELGLGDWLERFDDVVNHDAHDPRDLVEVGASRRGTRFVVNRCLAEADLVVATGCIKPHYFAGFGAGAKALFPGLGENHQVRVNHRLKEEPLARAGIVDGNPCREDLEEIAEALPAQTYLVNLVTAPEGGFLGAVAGDLRQAFRRGAELARRAYRVRCPAASCIVVSDELPVTASLYQASKLVAAAAPALLPGGTLVIAACCEDGVGPLDVVNRGIYEIGLKPRLPADHRIVLVSGLDRATVSETYCEWALSVEAAVGDRPALVLPRASTALLEVGP